MAADSGYDVNMHRPQRFLISFAWTGVALAAVASPQENRTDSEIPRIESKDVNLWRSWLLPSEADSAWMEAIPWLPSFAEGIRKSNEKAKPLLLWVMNGHPLGCT